MAGAISNEDVEQTTEAQETATEAGRRDATAGGGSAVEAAVTAAATAEKEEIAPECLIKHPLQNEWTLWYLEMDRSKSWEDMLNEITSFDTVEDFWSLYNHIRFASDLKQGNDYSLFKKNIRPMWEDDANKHGGRWVISLTRSQRRNELDTLWLDILLCLIGEAFEDSNEICGAVVNVRPRGDKISIWTADGKNRKSILSIGKKIRESLRLPADNQIIYELHKDAANKSSSKAAYTL